MSAYEKVEVPSGKEKIIEAALELFYYQGFHATSVRQIATKAEVNLALISYYFGGKKGLLEQLMVEFYEGYFFTIERAEEDIRKRLDRMSGSKRLLQVLTASFDYLFSSYQMTRFIYRELTMDSMLVREVMTIYLAKEKYYYLTILEDAVQTGELKQPDLQMMTFQVLNMLYMPFLQPQVIREVYYVEPLSEEFRTRYLSQLQETLVTLFHPSSVE